MKKFHHINQEKFDLVKTLQRVSLPSLEIQRLANLAAGTVHYLKKFDTLEEYQKWTTEQNLARKKNKEVVKDTFKSEDLPYFPARPLFESINNRLGRIIEILEALLQK